MPRICSILKLPTTKGKQMNTTDIATARKIDTQLAELASVSHKHQRLISTAWATLKAYGCTDLERARVFATRNVFGQRSQRIATAIETIEAETSKAWAIQAKMNKINEDHYTGWNRFFLVQHLHNTMYCSSFRRNTQLGWMPEISGLSEEEAVAEYGSDLCTKCFTTAPTR